MNPWDLPQAYNQFGQDMNSAYDGMQAGQQNISNLQNRQQGLQSVDYPAMTNSYGLGSQPAMSSAITTANQKPQDVGITTSSQGFNPWSLSGEALSR